DNCCLVCTLPSSTPPYGEAGERALRELQRIYGRVEKVYAPVEGVEIYEVIRKRLFDDLGDEKIRKEVAQSYFEYYQKLGTEVPSEVREIEYRERMEHAYPFHPELIDVLYERWGSYYTFQRTRGVLRLLALVVADLYNRKVVSPLIHSSLVNLEDQTIRREFIKHIGNEYDSVIEADIVGKARSIDKKMGSEYAKYNIPSGIATSVFLYSFGGTTKNETTLPRIRVALLREGIPHTIVSDAIGKLEEELWYFHSEKKQYSFKKQPNLNRMIIDKEETISKEKIEEHLKDIIKKNAGKSLEIYLWPESSSDIPDNKNLKLVILSPECPHDSENEKKLVDEFFERAGNGFRVYKNTLFIIAMDDAHYNDLLKSLKHFLALSALLDDESLVATLAPESQDELKNKLKDAEKDIPLKILTAYRYLVLLEESGLKSMDLGIPTVGEKITISERVKQYLKDQEKILTRVTVKYIIDKTFAKKENEKALYEIYELTFKTPGMALLESENVLYEAIKEGVKKGLVGLKEGSEVYYQQEVTPMMDSIILREEVAKKIKEMEVKGEEKEEKLSEENLEKAEEKKVEIVKKLTLRAKVPWDKLSYIVSGVIGPLKNKGLLSEITIEIKAESKEGFDRTTLDSKVRETLDQINAKIEEWKEE
ncbi:MAG: ATPase, partial [Candidatus Micrarchaeia archaeon]